MLLDVDENVGGMTLVKFFHLCHPALCTLWGILFTQV